MEVAFYLNNQNYSDVDFSQPEKGNPGVRGTQYMIWAVACGLSRKYENIQVCLYANHIRKMPPDIMCKRCENDLDAIKQAEIDCIDILILRTSISTDRQVFEKLRSSKLSCITWSHNFEDFYLANEIAKTAAIKRNVCVGRQQYERLRDHQVFRKSTYIYNALNFDCYDGYPRNDGSHIVVYAGMLDSSKGFHRLAKIWPQVLIKDKNAVLYVLGSGDLGANVKLGPLGLAGVEYEKKIAKYLCDKEGKVIPSVKFYGKVGGEKQRKIMSQAKVGIANPTGIGETFCIVAIEFEALGVPVVSVKKYGLLDTVEDGKAGILSNTDKGLVNAIVRLLNEDATAEAMGEFGHENVRKKFSFSEVLADWQSLLNDVYEGKENIANTSYNYPLNQGKIFREINRKIKTIPIFRGFPSIMECEYKIRFAAKKLLRR